MTFQSETYRPQETLLILLLLLLLLFLLYRVREVVVRMAGVEGSTLNTCVGDRAHKREFFVCVPERGCSYPKHSRPGCDCE